MTDEEIKQFCKQANETKIHGTDKDLYITYQAAIACTVIDYIRKDLKKIVTDAVKDAVGTLNLDKNSISPDESDWHDFAETLAETLYGNYKNKRIIPRDYTGKHFIVPFSSRKGTGHLNKLYTMGIRYFEEIQGYLTESPIGEPYKLLVNGKWVECQKNFTAYDFAGLSEDMKLLGLDFKSSPMNYL